MGEVNKLNATQRTMAKMTMNLNARKLFMVGVTPTLATRKGRSMLLSVRTNAAGSSGGFVNRCKELRQKFNVLEKAVGVQFLLAAPALAEEAAAEPGKLFDFDFTLPIMAAQFLLLMVFLDKTWFSPVGKVLDERDENLREKLSSVQDNSAKLDALKAKLEAQYNSAMTTLEAEEKEARSSLEPEIENLAKQIVDKVI